MSMLLFILHELWSIIDDSGSVVSSVVSSHPTLLSFHMLAGNVDRARCPLEALDMTVHSRNHERGYRRFSTEKLFGLGKDPPEMLDALVVFVEGDHLGDGRFLTLMAAQGELQFDTHTGASPGSSDR
jgi:hypothetical protein